MTYRTGGGRLFPDDTPTADIRALYAHVFYKILLYV